MEPYLALKNVKVWADKKEIINIEALNIKKGEVLGLLGANGAGKSTLLRVLSLIQKPTEGNVIYENKIIANPKSLRENISFVFQENFLFKGSVRSNIKYPLQLRKLTKSEINDKVNSIIEDFQLNGVADQDASTLSGGESKKVCLARALVYEPQILLLDEPFNNLDANVRKKIKKKVFDYVKNKNITTIFVSHYLDEVLSYCENLAVMRGGKILQKAAIDEVFANPGDEYVAKFLGDTSFIEARVNSYTNGMAQLSAGKHQFSVASKDDLHAGQKVFINIRPEDIFISNNGAFMNSSVRNSFKAEIDSIENRQAFSRLRLVSGFVTEVNITKQSVEELDLHKGKKIMAGFKATAVKILTKHSDD